MRMDERLRLAQRLLLDAEVMGMSARGYALDEPVAVQMRRRAADCAAAAEIIAPGVTLIHQDQARSADAMMAPPDDPIVPPPAPDAMTIPTLQAAIETAELALSRAPDDALRSPVEELRSIVAELEREGA